MTHSNQGSCIEDKTEANLNLSDAYADLGKHKTIRPPNKVYNLNIK
jgi:hypothetical protein